MPSQCTGDWDIGRCSLVACARERLRAIEDETRGKVSYDSQDDWSASVGLQSYTVPAQE